MGATIGFALLASALAAAVFGLKVRVGLWPLTLGLVGIFTALASLLPVEVTLRTTAGYLIAVAGLALAFVLAKYGRRCKPRSAKQTTPETSILPEGLWLKRDLAHAGGTAPKVYRNRSH